MAGLSGYSGKLMKVSGSQPIPVQEIVSALYIAPAFLLAATIAAILIVAIKSKRENAQHVVQPQQEAEKKYK